MTPHCTSDEIHDRYQHHRLYLSDPDSLDNDVKAIIADPDNILYTSVESAKELVIAYRNKGLLTNRWKNVEDMLHSIEDEYCIYIRPLNREHIYTYARLRLNTQQDHKDPSDHVIISHAITPSRSTCR